MGNLFLAQRSSSSIVFVWLFCRDLFQRTLILSRRVISITFLIVNKMMKRCIPRKLLFQGIVIDELP